MPLLCPELDEYLFGEGYGVGLPDAPEGMAWKQVGEDGGAGNELFKDKQGNNWYLVKEKYKRR